MSTVRQAAAWTYCIVIALFAAVIISAHCAGTDTRCAGASPGTGTGTERTGPVRRLGL